ncbi:phosphate ABC transporter substrate-binding protein [Alteromonas sp. McT4-15]|uniref:phosphate ABC transporter substrate-binding protein n=1 Tax=Alteromonas sp. McT4-15 TaxID=2881256 RepID=UPI001CF8DF16|nr:phosphate ABC transporter substrate-binding protein [Alteromonas sp. McT4-15]MCB4437234.1 phosphate ABC transporter substrate-binding protein [Alteromonas sp. McT4-15]MEC8231948.1 phosphate ABC transporter substrate-binding protein [Pseudomonadota bacterium]
MPKKSLAWLLVASAMSLSAAAEIAVIVHPSNSSAIDPGVVERLYLGKNNQFPDGSEALPINIGSGSSLDNFNSSVLGRSTAQVKSYWSKQIFTGKGTPPKEVGNDASVLDLVANNKNAIGYVDAAQVSDGVKVVFTK